MPPLSGKPARSSTDPAEITRWLALVIPPDQTFEIRAPDSTAKGKNSRTCRGNALAPAAAFAQLHSGQAQAVYYTINSVRPDLKNGDAAGTSDIIRRVLIFFDLDPNRPGGTSATDAEKAKARTLADTIRAFLRGRGWPEGAVVDSGNGFHLVYRIDLPAADDGLVKAVLIAMSKRFNTDDVKVDTAVFDPPRLAKLPGTLACKGENTADRPHRMAWVIDAPAELVAVSADQLTALVDDEKTRRDLEADIERKRAPVVPSNGEPKPKRDPGAPLRPGDDFNARTKWSDLLIGWKHEKDVGGESRYCRPDKAGGTSATVNHTGTDRIHVFTSAVPGLEAGGNYTRFEVYTFLNHQGDFKAATKALAALGYGEPSEAPETAAGTVAGPAPSTNGDGKPHEPDAEDDYATAEDAELGILDAEDIEEENPEWLEEERFLRGKINLIAGEGGDGKTTIAIAIGAGVTRGVSALTGKSIPVGRVAILAAEDGAADTIIPRFKAAGGAVSRLKILKARVTIPRKGNRPAMVHPVDLQDLPYWREIFKRLLLDVLIVDPVPAYLGRGVNDHKNSDVQTLLNQFADLAGEFRACVIAITHTGKAKDLKLVHKVLGSVAYTNCARVVHVTVRDPDDEKLRYLARAKCNLDEERDPLSYKLVAAEYQRNGKTFKTSRVEFDPEPVKVDVQAMANGDTKGKRGPDPKKTLAVAEWLYDFLIGRPGPTPLGAIFDAAGEAGHVGARRDNKWSNPQALYRAFAAIPTLGPPREGAQTNELEVQLKTGGKHVKHWQVIGPDTAF